MAIAAPAAEYDVTIAQERTGRTQTRRVKGEPTRHAAMLAAAPEGSGWRAVWCDVVTPPAPEPAPVEPATKAEPEEARTLTHADLQGITRATRNGVLQALFWWTLPAAIIWLFYVLELMHLTQGALV